MKIDGNRPTHDTQATDGARRTGKDAGVRPGVTVTPGSSGDRVELSGDAALLVEAVKKANEASGIRTDLVERMREKLAAGKVGNDSTRLAEAILDDLLK